MKGHPQRMSHLSEFHCFGWTQVRLLGDILVPRGHSGGVAVSIRRGGMGTAMELLSKQGVGLSGNR